MGWLAKLWKIIKLFIYFQLACLGAKLIYVLFTEGWQAAAITVGVLLFPFLFGLYIYGLSGNPPTDSDYYYYYNKDHDSE